jgi:hypothetical protein
MAMHPGASVGLVVLGAVAASASTGTAMVVGGVVLALAAPLFVVREREGGGVRRDTPPMLGRDGDTTVVGDGVEERHD